MVEINPAAFLQNRTDHSALVTRTLADALTNGSAVVGVNDLKVSQHAAGANMSVDVAGGICFIEGTESATQGAYCCRSDGTATNVTLAASNATLPRIDLIVAKVQDAFYSGATNAWSIVAVTGTAAASPVAPSAPANSLILAQVSVGANVTTIVTANISDKRLIASGRLYTGDFTCTSTTRPAVPWTGLTIFETDTRNRYVWDGSTWQFLGSAGREMYSQAVGLQTVNYTTGGTSGSSSVSFPAGRFSVAPAVFASFNSAPSAVIGATLFMFSITSTGFTLQINAAPGSTWSGTGSVNVSWSAWQGTPTTLAG